MAKSRSPTVLGLRPTSWMLGLVLIGFPFFQYVINRAESGAHYGFQGRLVWKKFVSPEDCLHEYEMWKAGLADARISG